MTRVTTLDAALASEDEFPLQQTLLLPYAWTYVVYQRRPVRRTRTSAIAYLFRIYWLLCADVLFHACLVPLVNVVRRRALTRWFLKDGAPKMLWMAPPHIDDSARILVTRHELFKHLEMELIVPAAHIREAVECLQVVVSVFAGENQTIPSPWQARFERIGMLHLLDSSRGTYLHHYPLLIRRILPDDTLISMTSASQRPYYSISVFTYARDKSGMYPLARFLALAMTRLYQARLHWGKHLPVGRAELESSYPGLDAFRDVCARVDPHGVFSNSFTRQALGIDRTSPD